MNRAMSRLRGALFVAVLAAAATTRAADTPAASGVNRPPSRPAPGPLRPLDPNRPVPGKFKHPKLVGWVNDVPDTGQFLADSVWILRVGPRVTSVGDFVRGWFSSYPEYRPGQDSLGRVQFLRNIMNRDIMGLTASALDRPLGFEDRLAIRETRQRSLAFAVYQRFVRDSVKVSEDEVRSLWQTFSWMQHFRHILVPDRNAAERVRRELVSGRITWVAAVKKYSIATNDKGPDGDLGWGQRDKLDASIANQIYGLRPGETSMPLQDREGWHVVQSVERKPQTPPAYGAFTSSLRDQISETKAAERSEQLLALLRLQSGMEYDTANVVFAASKFGETTKLQQEAMSATFNINASLPEFSQEDTSRVLARWKNGGRYTIGSLNHSFSDIPPVMRPNLNLPDALFGFIESTVLEPNIAEHGAQMGLDKDPLVAEPVRKKREELLVEHLYQDSVGTRVWVSKDERTDWYKKNLSQFFTYPWVEFAAIVRSSKAGADSVERMLKSGLSARALLRADSLSGRSSGTIQQRNQHENGSYQKALFEELRPGGVQVRGPDAQGDYAILQLISYNPGRQLSYEESEGMIDESLQNPEADAAVQALIERLKPRYEIAWRPELVPLIKLVDPTVQ